MSQNLTRSDMKGSIRQYLQKQPARIKVLYCLWIIQVRANKNQIGITYCKKRVNPYNPLSYMLIIVIAVVTGVTEIVSSIPDIKDQFKYK